MGLAWYGVAMSSFFRKVASAFVVIEDSGSPASEQSVPSPGGGLEEITHDTSALLAQLEGRAGSPSGAPPDFSAGSSSAMDMTAEDVFRAQAIGDAPSSSLRLIKLVAGLSMFPREQQLAMVRAMDAADDSWAEPEVVKDAQMRQRALRDHLVRVAQERSARTQTLTQEIEQSKQSGQAVLAELDKRIAELYARREQEAAATATAISKLEQQQKELEAREARARQGVAQVIQALGGLLTFLGIPQGPDSP